jgi:type I restriction enzyme S subunit
MSWQETTVDQLGKVVTGKTPPTKNRAMYDGDYMFVTPTDLDWQSYYVRETHSTVTELAREKHKNQFIPANSTVFTCIGNTIGKCGLTSEDCLSNQQINSIVPNDKHDPKFVYYLLNHNRPSIRSIGLSGGAAQPKSKKRRLPPFFPHTTT